MVLPKTGALPFSEIMREFGMVGQVKGSQMYRNAGIVPDNYGSNAQVPASGEMRLSTFFGCAGMNSTGQVSITIDADFQTVVGDTAKRAAFEADAASSLADAVGLPVSNITVTLTPGSIVASFQVMMPATGLVNAAATPKILALESAGSLSAVFGSGFVSKYGLQGSAITAATARTPPSLLGSGSATLGSSALSSGTLSLALSSLFSAPAQESALPVTYSVTPSNAPAVVIDDVMYVPLAERGASYTVFAKAVDANGTETAPYPITVTEGSATSLSASLGTKYPPAPMTAATTTLTGQAYGNGTYVATQSSFYGPEPNAVGWAAFDYNPNTYHSSDVLYNTNTGVHTGTTTTTVGGVSVKGEWLQLQLPAPILLRSYVMTPRSTSYSSSRQPGSFVLAGSTNGSTWTQVDARTGVYYANRVPSTTFAVPSPSVQYSYYRLIARVMGDARNPRSRDCWNLSALVLRTDVPPTPSLPSHMQLVGSTSLSDATFDMNAYQTVVDAGTLTWSLTGQPAGVGIDPATGVIRAFLGAQASGGTGPTLTVTGASGSAATATVSFFLTATATTTSLSPAPGPASVLTARMLSPFNIAIGGNMNKLYDYDALLTYYSPIGTVFDKWFYLHYNGSVFRLMFNNAENSQIRNTHFYHAAASGWVTATGVAANVTPTPFSSQLPTTSDPWNVQPWSMLEMRSMPGLGASAATVAASYSLRPLTHRDGNRKVVNVRRSSDNATTDLFADPFGVKLSTSTGQKYESWLAGATGYVVRWYDQSVNGRHMTQATAAMQPTLLLEPMSGEYAVFFSGGDAATKTGLSVATAFTARGLSMVYNAFPNTSGWQTLVGANTDNYGLRTLSNRFPGASGDASGDFVKVAGATGTINGTPYMSGVDWPYQNHRWNHVVATNPTNYAYPFSTLGLPASTSLYDRAFHGYMHEVVLFSTTPSATDMAQLRMYRPIRDLATSVPVRSGMVGYYTGESWDAASSRWYDVSGTGNNHVTEVAGTVSVAQYPGTSLRYLYGTTATVISFPAAILPATYTLFHVTRYNGATKGRILTGKSNNWISGHHAGKTGVAYHGGTWITPTLATEINHDGWFQSTDTNTTYRSGKVNRTTTPPVGTPTNGNLCINNYIGGEQKSDWAVAMVLVYNRTLSDSEIREVEEWIGATYPGDNPFMRSSNTLPLGFVASASSSDPSFAAWNAFDSSTAGVGWKAADATLPAWLQLQHDEVRVLESYVVKPDVASGGRPRSWEMRGSLDGAAWTTLDVRKYQKFDTAGTERTYTVPASAVSAQAYLYFRLWITATTTTTTGVGGATAAAASVHGLRLVTHSPVSTFTTASLTTRLDGFAMSRVEGTTWSTTLPGGPSGTLVGSPAYTYPGLTFTTATAANQHVTIPSVANVTDFNNTQAYTVSVWVNLSSTQQLVERVIVEKWTSDNGPYPYVIRSLNTGGVRSIEVAAHDGTNTPKTQVINNTLDKWMNIVATFDHVAKRVNMYIDGVYMTGITYPTLNNCSNNNPVYLMTRGGTTDLNAAGQVGHFSIHNRVLTMEEIASNYDAYRGYFDNVVQPYTSLSITSATACAVYGFKLQNAFYDGPVAQIRRSSDNAISEFYATSAGVLGTGVNGSGVTLSAWLNGATGYVAGWYDQTGRGNHLTQATVANQPLVQQSGATTFVRFDTVTATLSGPNAFPTSTVADMHMVFASRENARVGQTLVSLNGSVETVAGRFYVHAPWSDGVYYFDASNGTDNRSVSPANATQVGTRVTFSGYKSASERMNAFRLNGGTRYFSTTNTAATVSNGVLLNGTKYVSTSVNHDLYGLMLFSNKLSSADEATVEAMVG